MMIVCRAPRLLHRVATDRVLLREVGGAAHELRGPAALTWIAADEPADVATLEARVGEVHPHLVPSVADAVTDLLAAGLLRKVEAA